jgi:hypothetical protein
LGQCSLLIFFFLITAFLPYYLYYQQVHKTVLTSGLIKLVSYAAKEDVDSHRWFLQNGFQPGREMKGVLRGFAPDPFEPSIMLKTGGYILRFLLIIFLFIILFYAKSIWKTFGWTAFILTGWLIAFFLLFSTYNVGSVKFVAFILIPFIFLFAMAVTKIPWRRTTFSILGAGILLLFFNNLNSVIIPNAKLENNIHYTKAMFIRDHTDKKDLVIHLGKGENIYQKVYLPYFAVRKELILDFLIRANKYSKERVTQGLDWKINNCWNLGGQVFVLSEVIQDSPFVKRFLENRKLPSDFLQNYFKSFNLKLIATFNDNFKLYLITPPQRNAIQKNDS